LTGFGAQAAPNHRPRQLSFGLAALVCVILLSLLTVVQVAHEHPLGADADHCPLCIVMHSAAPVAVAAAAVVLVEIATPAPVFAVRAMVRHWHPTLFTRPPPIG
jgi:hypothetical protein